MTRIADISGQKFGRLTAVRINHREPPKTFWFCLCDCGNNRIVPINDLRTGHTKSCGCFKRDEAARKATTHGLSKDGVRPDGYYSWQSIMRRCYTKTNEHYPNYGGRGITVCDRWRGDMGVARFLEDMGPKPTKNHTVGRKDSNGPYCPDNCRWEDDFQQGQNTRRVTNLTVDGVTKCVSEWAREVGISQTGLRARLAHGWTPEEAIKTPKFKRGRQSQNKTETAGCDKGRINLESFEWV